MSMFQIELRFRRRDAGSWSSLVQERIELGPNFIFLGAKLDVTEAAFLSCAHFGGRSFWLMMIEIVVAPPVGSGIALGILDRHICAIEWAREIAAPRSLDARTVVVLLRQRELELLEQDGPFGKLVRLLVDRVGAWLDVDVVIFREAGARLGRVR